ncbi:uncharacterized protein DS421_20g699110 [Arachis hypogaea]|nr:uncharacterized protein DS421_20g699110 [Arachis hypogaea]
MWDIDAVKVCAFTITPKFLGVYEGILVKNISSADLLSVELLELESDKDAVSEYIGEKATKVTSSSLRTFFRTKNVEKQGSSSHLRAEKGVEVDQPTHNKKVSYKRKRVDGKKERVVNLDEGKVSGKDIDLEQVKRFTKNQRMLHGYRSDEDLTSLYSEHFPFSIVADEYSQSPFDVKLLHDVGDVDISQYLQVMGARLMCIDRTQELKHARDAFDKASMNKLMQEIVLVKENKLRDTLDLVNSLQEKLTFAKNAEKKFEEEKTALEARLVVLGVEKKQLEIDKEDHGLEMFAAGFDRAVEQAKLLTPNVDLSLMDPCKVVVGGALVEDEENGGEGEGENPNAP